MSAVPAEVFACDPDSRVLAVEGVHGFKVRENSITQLTAREWRRRFLRAQKRVDIAKDPWRTMRRAAEHYSVRAREIKYRA